MGSGEILKESQYYNMARDNIYNMARVLRSNTKYKLLYLLLYLLYLLLYLSPHISIDTFSKKRKSNYTK